MVNPVPGYKPTTAYRKPGRLWSLGFHTGTDFAAPKGTRIVAAAAGKVVRIDYSKAYGWRVTIASTVDGVFGWANYCHMPARPTIVKVGQQVDAGQRIGTVGATGNVTGPHLHLEWMVAPYTFAAKNFRDPMTIVNAGAGTPSKPVVVDLVKRPKTKPSPAGVSHTEWNLAGFDKVGQGADTFVERIPANVAEIKAIGSDVFSLLEVPNEHVDNLERALAKIGYVIGVAYQGRVIAVRKGLRIGRHATYDLPTTGPAKDTRQSVYLEVWFGKNAWLFDAGHFEHRPGDKYDPTRVAQAKEHYAKGEHLRKSWDIHKTRWSSAADENSNSWVVDQAFEPHDMFDVFEGAWEAVNPLVGTNPGWGKSTPQGPRIDKIKRHRDRPVLRAHVRKASAGLNDHLPTTVVYGSTAA
jgi:hypothetical protein